MKVLTLTLYGHISGKKNAYGQTKSGRRYKPKAIVKETNDLVLQIRMQTGNLEPLVRPRISALFYCRDMRGDLDNKWTALLDAMKIAGIIKDDNLANVDNFSVRGEVDKDERVLVRLEID